MTNLNLEKRTERMEALRGLMDRLCAPDLMLPEATTLRNRLSVLLRESEDEGACPTARALVLAPVPAHEGRPRIPSTSTPSLRSEKVRSGVRWPLSRCIPCLTG